MEIISEPEYVEELVTDIDVMLAGGVFQNHTLRMGEKFEEFGDRVTLTTLPSGNNLLSEVLVFFRPHGILGYRMAIRMERRLVKTPLGARPESPVPPTVDEFSNPRVTSLVVTMMVPSPNTVIV